MLDGGFGLEILVLAGVFVFWSRASPPCLVRNPCLSLKHRFITAIRQRDKPTIITTVSCGVEAHSEGFRERQDLLRWIDDFTFMTVFHGILSCYVIAVLLSFHLRSSGWLNALLFEWVSWKISPKSRFALRTESSGAERSAWIAVLSRSISGWKPYPTIDLGVEIETAVLNRG